MILLLEGDRLAKRNAFILSLGGALAGANTAVMFATASILGHSLAPEKSLATLPVSLYVVGLALATLPLGMSIKRFGRRASYMGATIFGVLAGLLGMVATFYGSFLALSLATPFAGMYAAAVQSYRFAAADTATPEFRPKAISWVLIGGVFAGILGPQLVVYTENLLPQYVFLFTFLCQALVALVACFVLTFLHFPALNVEETGQGRALVDIIRTPRFIVAVICGLASYMTMNFVMTAAPLAMKFCNHTNADAAYGIQWHIIGMFAPSFFTGSLIIRFGVVKIIALGFIISALSGVVAMSGQGLWQFWGSLILLGLGWNFSYIGASTLVTECHTPQERTKVQSFNDFCIFSGMAIGSFASGQVLLNYGWNGVNAVLYPFIALAFTALLYMSFKTKNTAKP